DDEALGVSVDDVGSASITGYTQSFDFPQVNPLPLQSFNGRRDAFVAELSDQGELLFSSYLGGSVIDEGRGIAAFPGAIPGNETLTVTGITASPDFPTQNAFQPNFRGGTDAFVTKINPNDVPSSFVYSSFLGGSGNEDIGFGAVSGGVAVDNLGFAFVTGAT